jgi:hypothetical protein
MWIRTPVSLSAIGSMPLRPKVHGCAAGWHFRLIPGSRCILTRLSFRTLREGSGALCAGTSPALKLALVRQHRTDRSVCCIASHDTCYQARAGLASFLRRRQLGARLGGPSLPLDIGYAETIPAGIRNAVTLRDRHCQWAGGCNQPAAACEVHHTKHKANGGKTSVKDCVLLCSFHHQIVIHHWGWTLVLNPDGTTTAWNKDKTKTLHSHGPPARAG